MSTEILIAVVLCLSMQDGHNLFWKSILQKAERARMPICIQYCGILKI